MRGLFRLVSYRCSTGRRCAPRGPRPWCLAAGRPLWSTWASEWSYTLYQQGVAEKGRGDRGCNEQTHLRQRKGRFSKTCIGQLCFIQARLKIVEHDSKKHFTHIKKRGAEIKHVRLWCLSWHVKSRLRPGESCRHLKSQQFFTDSFSCGEVWVGGNI